MTPERNEVRLSSGHRLVTYTARPAKPSRDKVLLLLNGGPGFPFDYLFTPERYATRLVRCDVMLDARDAKEASDHFPLLVELAGV